MKGTAVDAEVSGWGSTGLLIRNGLSRGAEVDNVGGCAVKPQEAWLKYKEKKHIKGPYPCKWHVFVLALVYIFQCLNE